MVWILIIFLAVYGAWSIVSTIWGMIQKMTKLVEKLTGENQETKVEVQSVPTVSNPADKPSKQEQQPSKKIAKQKVEKFLQVLSVEILRDMSKKHNLPVSRIKADLVKELIDTMERMRTD